MEGYYPALEYVVPPEDNGRVLKSIMKGRMNCSKRLITRLKKTEWGITLNGERVFVNTKVKTGDRIALYMEIETSEWIEPEDIPLDVVYEDAAILVINKPAGFIVHPTYGHYAGTIANAVMHYAQANGEQYRFRPVHRLDEGTSGLLMVAKNPYAHDQISRQLQENTVHKMYTAIVEGHPGSAKGMIDGPIARRPDNPHIRHVSPEGAHAVTYYHVLEKAEQFTMLHVQLETGRTHQIRVHLQHINCPIIGDDMYNPQSEWNHLITRPALHASKLTLSHPMSGETITFEAKMPEDMEALWSKCSSGEVGVRADNSVSQRGDLVN